MAKRKAEIEIDETKEFKSDFGDKHTLDSDEEDYNSDENVLDYNDIEGEEDGIERVDTEAEIKITPFNLKEELEEGRFDGDGHYHWNKEANVKDNWLDNIDWVKIKKNPNYKEKKEGEESNSDSDSDEEPVDSKFNLIQSYKEVLAFMQPGDSIQRSLQRLGKNKPKITTAQRWKMKKSGIKDDSADGITKLTELANEILTKTGNMDIYDMTYEQVQRKIQEADSKPGTSKLTELDMYADDFDDKEKDKLAENPSTSAETSNPDRTEIGPVAPEPEAKLMWEFKWKQTDEEIVGPFTTEEMQKKVDDGDFKEAVFVRKILKGTEDDRFYSSARLDFELYL